MPDFLTIKEVCQILRIGERTAYELCRNAQIGGAVRVGGQSRIDKTAFESWVKRGGGAADGAEHPEGKEAP